MKDKSMDAFKNILQTVFTGIVAAIFTMGAIFIYMDRSGGLHAKSTYQCKDSKKAASETP